MINNQDRHVDSIVLKVVKHKNSKTLIPKKTASGWHMLHEIVESTNKSLNTIMEPKHKEDHNTKPSPLCVNVILFACKWRGLPTCFKVKWCDDVWMCGNIFNGDINVMLLYDNGERKTLSHSMKEP